MRSIFVLFIADSLISYENKCPSNSYTVCHIADDARARYEKRPLPLFVCDFIRIQNLAPGHAGIGFIDYIDAGRAVPFRRNNGYGLIRQKAGNDAADCQIFEAGHLIHLLTHCEC